MKEIMIQELDELKLVGFRVLCSGDQYLVEIPKASLILDKRIGEIKQVINPDTQIGAFVVENQTPDEDGYWVSVEVKEYEDVPVDMVTLTIPPQRYAVLRHTGSNREIREAYNGLHKWVEDNKYVRLKNKWHLERFYEWKDTEKVDVDLLDTIE
ncbi:GyrI-like domain-containing protein [Metasolibacillus sp.]|uniref:GyrI-like domain-containing protein n=1 Tax=Metasolibacillus sp. TaxID=2703680 RepID=UPI0025E25677|nr:GyrI-like domain-containing protein [Metasolibacillus sp.]MCT6924778.1 GyrI-like domain-containing protein [Metasolibacillus sp.]MCT6941046.1 GyrI-like domain-containing protein [Metasolibacillus sp.]